MAPMQSRSVHGSRFGIAALAVGGLTSTQLFLTPSASLRAPATGSARTAGSAGEGAAIRAAAVAAPSGAATALPSLIGAAAALLLARGAAGRKTALAAVATADADAVPPPPPPFNPAGEIGAVAPLGFFDPLGFTKVGDESGFRQLRAAEIKHGRVAMMASIGAVGQHFLRFPGFEKAHGTFGAMLTGEGVLGFVVLFAASGILELAWKDAADREPGNFGDPFGVNMYNEDMRAKEISNGRMAMISVLGIFAAELATGKDAIEQFGF